MLFGSIDNVFGAVQGSVETFGGSLGTFLGTGTGSGTALLGRVFEAIFAGSGQEIPPIALNF